MTRTLLSACMLFLLALLSTRGWAQEGPPQEVFLPKGEKGPVAVVVSGQSGPPNYRTYAGQVVSAVFVAPTIPPHR